MKDNGILGNYASDDAVNYVLIVNQTALSEAKAELFEKNEGGWTLLGEFAAFIGRNGIGKCREGDGKTPSGEMRVTAAFGRQPNPGTTLQYIDVKDTTCACDEDCRYYNQIVDLSLLEHPCKGEMMATYSPQYDYGLVTDYNKENIYPLGSAIFIHCKGTKKSTSGCISLDKEDMLTLMKVADKGLVIFVQQ